MIDSIRDMSSLLPKRRVTNKSKNTTASQSMSRSPAKHHASLSTSRLRFLVGDLRLPYRRVAAMLDAPLRAVERETPRAREGWTSRPYSVCIYRELIELMGGLDPGPLPLGDREWPAMRERLARQVAHMATNEPDRWRSVDEYLWGLQYVLNAADARVEERRLRFLHGDLGMPAVDIAKLLNASWLAARTALTRFDIKPHAGDSDDLGESHLREFAHRLGVSEWTRASTSGRWDRYWPTVKAAARDGLLDLARRGRLDLAVFDTFLDELAKAPRKRSTRAAA